MSDDLFPQHPATKASHQQQTAPPAASVAPAAVKAVTFAIPAELQGPTPRPLPVSIHEGPVFRRQKLVRVVLALAGVVCLALSPVPFIQSLSLYILPLGYLAWIGGGLLLISAFQFMFSSVGDWKYIRDGQAGQAVVTELKLACSAKVNGQPTQHAYFAALETLHPDTRQKVPFFAKSRDISTDRRSKVQPRFRVGDTVTIVWLPNQFESTARVYDFLELTPESALVYENQDKPASQRLFEIIAGTAAISGLFFVLFWNVYAFGRFVPFNVGMTADHLWPGLLGAVVLGGGTVLGLWWNERKQQAAAAKRAARDPRPIDEEPYTAVMTSSGLSSWVLRIILVAGSLLLGGLTAQVWAYSVNALLDTSQPVPTPVVIKDMVMTTHSFLFREYTIEYEFAGQKDEYKLLSTPAHMATFRSAQAFAMVRKGYLGWEWVSDLVPAQAVPQATHPVQPRAPQQPATPAASELQPDKRRPSSLP